MDLKVGGMMCVCERCDVFDYGDGSVRQSGRVAATKHQGITMLAMPTPIATFHTLTHLQTYHTLVSTTTTTHRLTT